MPRLVDLWRAIDPEARLVAGDAEHLLGPVRSVSRTRAAPPHLPPPGEGQLVVVDGALLAILPPDRLVSELAASGHVPAGLLVALVGRPAAPDWGTPAYPILVSGRSAADLAARAGAYLADEHGHLARLEVELRLAAAESALTDPRPAAAAGLVALRLRRGVAVVADGELVALHPRPSGRALAARFAAAFSRLLGAPGTRAATTRRLRDGLWVHEQPIRPSAAVWVFDDRPLARADEAAAAALAVTLRALLRRAVPAIARPTPRSGRPTRTPPAAPDRLTATLMAVARANGRVAPAARSLGVHRNTVLYRLRVARSERGIDPRRPEDALRLLREVDGPP